MELKKFKFEKLQVWDLAMDFGERIHDISVTFPSKELYNLQSQINRAVDSIALNISEGATGNTNPEFRKFLTYSIRSIAEVVCCLFKAKRRNYISEEIFETLYSEAFILMNKTAALRNSLK
ncbi:four helix bundle protein [Flavobacterium salilacus subsp. salilacus]|uniref:four helix bundle protein n=1 Tax=Flavobacterium TaxID=237 RepID=UPI0010752A27|nr:MULTISPECIES: four helix bundle protein [Flavobacterium]KAF2516260.1 four helix bundle protein [Flavobacterium salilacus subsp. salilacus]MBE1613788.1 four helix bundle protein [Flavobacterium sp. SaA2.13]